MICMVDASNESNDMFPDGMRAHAWLYGAIPFSTSYNHLLLYVFYSIVFMHLRVLPKLFKCSNLQVQLVEVAHAYLYDGYTRS